jgi:hypothetical protein
VKWLFRSLYGRQAKEAKADLPDQRRGVPGRTQHNGAIRTSAFENEGGLFTPRSHNCSKQASSGLSWRKGCRWTELARPTRELSGAKCAARSCSRWDIEMRSKQATSGYFTVAIRSPGFPGQWTTCSGWSKLTGGRDVKTRFPRRWGALSGLHLHNSEITYAEASHLDGRRRP